MDDWAIDSKSENELVTHCVRYKFFLTLINELTRIGWKIRVISYAELRFAAQKMTSNDAVVSSHRNWTTIIVLEEMCEFDVKTYHLKYDRNITFSAALQIAAAVVIS